MKRKAKLCYAEGPKEKKIGGLPGIIRSVVQREHSFGGLNSGSLQERRSCTVTPDVLHIGLIGRAL